MSWTEADPRDIFGSAPIKAEGTTIAHDLSSIGGSVIYKASNRYPAYPAPLIIHEGDKVIVVSEVLQRLEYILQRTVPDYDELVNQFNAIKDIERCSNEQG